MADPKKFFDVAKPGKSAPSDSARPIITTHKMMSHDPMMSSSDNPSEMHQTDKQSAPIMPMTTKKIEPIVDDAVKDETKSPEPVVTVEARAESVPTEEEKPVEPEAALNEEAAPPVDDKGTTATSSDAPKPEATTSLSEASAADVENVEDKERKAAADKLAKEKAEQEKEAAQIEAIEKLVEEKKYFVKISQPKHQNFAMRIAIIIVLVLLLGFVAADLLIDAGIIKTSIPPVVDLIQN